MAKLSKPPIPLTLYKHFAVATLVLTAAIAMFADDGNREAMAEHIEEREREAHLRAASQEITGPPRLVRADTTPRGTFGSENAGYGAPTASAPRPSRGSGRSRSQSDLAGSAQGRISVPGYDQEWIDALGEQEYAIFRDQTVTGNLASNDGDQAEGRRQMMERQRRRGGARGGSDYMP